MFPRMANFPVCSNMISLLLFFLISKLEDEKREVSVCSSSSLHLSYTILAKVHISSQLHSFYFPDVFMLQGQTSKNRSFPVRPRLHLSLSLLPFPSQPPQLPGSWRQILLQYFHYTIYTSTPLRGSASVKSHTNGTHMAKKHMQSVL